MWAAPCTGPVTWTLLKTVESIDTMDLSLTAVFLTEYRKKKMMEIQTITVIQVAYLVGSLDTHSADLKWA